MYLYINMNQNQLQPKRFTKQAFDSIYGLYDIYQKFNEKVYNILMTIHPVNLVPELGLIDNMKFFIVHDIFEI